jgi:hypothetical protein
VDSHTADSRAGQKMTTDIEAIREIIQGMEAQTDHLLELDGVERVDPAAMQAKAAPASASAPWCELILGRTTDPRTGRPWDPTLLHAIQMHTQNFLLLAWRARAAQMGGVPTLLAGGSGTALVPYRRMKTIGGKHVRVRGATQIRRRARTNLQRIRRNTSALQSLC